MDALLLIDLTAGGPVSAAASIPAASDWPASPFSLEDPGPAGDCADQTLPMADDDPDADICPPAAAACPIAIDPFRTPVSEHVENTEGVTLAATAASAAEPRHDFARMLFSAKAVNADPLADPSPAPAQESGKALSLSGTAPAPSGVAEAILPEAAPEAPAAAAWPDAAKAQADGRPPVVDDAPVEAQGDGFSTGEDKTRVEAQKDCPSPGAGNTPVEAVAPEGETTVPTAKDPHGVTAQAAGPSSGHPIAAPSPLVARSSLQRADGAIQAADKHRQPAVQSAGHPGRQAAPGALAADDAAAARDGAPNEPPERQAGMELAERQDGPGRPEVRLIDTTPNSRIPSAMTHAVGRQLVEAAAAFPDRPVEITLAPDELGRVRMVMTAADGILTLSLTADRPETLDLMRRHIDQLAQDFRDLGFASLRFSFAERDPGQSGTGFRTNDPGGDTVAEAQPQTNRNAPPATGRLPGGGLDIRL